MVHLVSLPDPRGGPGSARMWFNPDHVVTAIPKLADDGTIVHLSVVLKLTGSPAFDAWLGDFDTRQAADVRWQAFLADLSRGGGA